MRSKLSLRRCWHAALRNHWGTLRSHERIAIETLVVAHQGFDRTYGNTAQVEALATGLLALGLGPGDRSGIWAPNCAEWCLTRGHGEIGAIMVCINPAYQVHEPEYALTKVGCKAIIAAERFKTSDYRNVADRWRRSSRTAPRGAQKRKASRA